MEKTQLLDTLNAQVAQYEQRREFINRANAQAASGKFSTQVIERVIRDHEAKCTEIAAVASPLLPKLQALVQVLDQRRMQLQAECAGMEEKVQEADLRAEIGEYTAEELEQAVGELRGRLSDLGRDIGAIDSDLTEIHAATKRWTDLAGMPTPAARPDSKRKTAAAAPAPVTPQPVPTPVAPPPVFVAPPAPPAPPVAAPAPPEPDAEEEEEDFGAHVSRTDIKDDVSMVYDAGVEAARGDDEIAIETGDTGDAAADAPAADVQFGFEEDILGGDASGASDVELDLGGGGASDVDVAPGRNDTATPEAAPAVSDAPRRALLLYQEGTAEEQIYPFTGDTLTIGRGRENDIQIKTDSKVSRYHCKLFRRGNNFYIEDAKSSNGTLVNGELITDRRLFGGEEVIVGETFFRFRIME